MLEGFLNSDEYKSMNKSSEDTIFDFYKGLLGRETLEVLGRVDKFGCGTFFRLKMVLKS